MDDYYHDVIRGVCPLTGEPIPNRQAFTDHARPGCFNSCAACHDYKRSLSERLADLEAERGAAP